MKSPDSPSIIADTVFPDRHIYNLPGTIFTIFTVPAIFVIALDPKDMGQLGMKNEHGLARSIPAGVKREVRKNSKFGCVLCRCGFFDYEHIVPEFKDARCHDPEKICCLCPGCHGRVTRGQLSKSAVAKAYEEIKIKKTVEVLPPRGPLDFHTGKAQLEFGGLNYAPMVEKVLRYGDDDLISLCPGKKAGEPGTISAIFTDPFGIEILRLQKNEWRGALDAWDIEVEGSTLTVRRKLGEVVLRLQLKPPGKIEVNILDMRYRDIHVLVRNGTYCIGRYLGDGRIFWVNVRLNINVSIGNGVLIWVADPVTLAIRDRILMNRGKSLATDNRDLVMHSQAGIMFKSVGLCIAAETGSFDLNRILGGFQNLSEVRKILKNSPTDLSKCIGNVYNFDAGVGLESPELYGKVGRWRNLAKD